MANCIIPIRVTKVGEGLGYVPLNKPKDGGIKYVASRREDLQGFQLISNDSLYNEMKGILNLFSLQNNPIILTSKNTELNEGTNSMGVLYDVVGEDSLRKYYPELSRGKMSSFQKPPIVVKRVNVKESYSHDEVDLSGVKDIAAHLDHHLKISSKIANITNDENNSFSIEGYLTEFLACPKCSGDGSYKSGLFLSVDISNKVSDDERILETYAQNIFDELKKNGFKWSPAHC